MLALPLGVFCFYFLLLYIDCSSFSDNKGAIVIRLEDQLKGIIPFIFSTLTC